MKRMLELLMSAYSTISVQETALFLGMNENDAINLNGLSLHVAVVMDTGLKSYASQCHLSVLGTHINDFVLYCPIVGTEALSPLETIGSFGVRNFTLCKKPTQQVEAVGDGKPVTVGITRKNSGSWKS